MPPILRLITPSASSSSCKHTNPESHPLLTKATRVVVSLVVVASLAVSLETRVWQARWESSGCLRSPRLVRRTLLSPELRWSRTEESREDQVRCKEREGGKVQVGEGEATGGEGVSYLYNMC